MTTLERVALFGGLALALGLVDLQAVRKERLRDHGAVVFLELASRDPRSLMQGDYMTLDFQIERDLRGAPEREGQFVVRLDARGVASFVRFVHPEQSAPPDERLLRYRQRGGRPRIGPESFFFQEGDAGRYARARYAGLRVAADGETLLVGLLDEGLRALGH